MSIDSSRHQSHAILIMAAVLLLTGASFDAPAQSRADDSIMMCEAQLMSGLTDSSGNGYCRGYLGRSCAGDAYASACNDGALARSRRGEEGEAQGNQSAAEEMEKARRLIEQMPRLPPDDNLLLGRWRYVPPLPSANPIEALSGLGNEVACGLIAGDGQSFEFRADALVHGTRVMDSMRYYRGEQGVVFALGERYLRLLAFEADGRDRITNGPCTFERVGPAAVTAPTAAQRPSATQPAQALPPVTYAPVDPRSALGQGIALHRAKDFQPALQQLLAATAANPNDARGWVFLADAYRWLGLEGDAEAALATALKLDPNALNALR